MATSPNANAERTSRDGSGNQMRNPQPGHTRLPHANPQTLGTRNKETCKGRHGRREKERRREQTNKGIKERTRERRQSDGGAEPATWTLDRSRVTRWWIVVRAAG